MKIKKILVTILVMVITITVLSIGSVKADTVLNSNGYSYTVSNKKATIVSIHSTGNVTIPSKLGGYPVTRIGLYNDNYGVEFVKPEKIKSISIPETVTSISGFASFGDCKNLKIISVSANNKYFSTLNGVLFNKKQTKLLRYPCGKSNVKYDIPNSVTSIGDYAFYNNCNNLTNISIPNSVIEIGIETFAECMNLKNIKISDNITNIQYGTFRQCKKLTEITIGRSVKEIEDYAFSSCEKIRNITLSKNIKTIGLCTFIGCNNIKNIFYEGSKKEWDKNDFFVFEFSDASIHYNSVKYPKTIKLSATSYVYNGKVKTPTVTVKDSAGKTLKKNTDYTVSIATGRKNVGKYAVTIKFKGNYKGTKTLYFTIKPASTTVKSLTAGKKSLKVAITKKTTQVTGYQIQYATNKSFKSAKSKTVSSYKTTSVNLTKLSAKKTYYVRVRTYKTVKGVKYYSAWSTAKYKKTK